MAVPGFLVPSGFSALPGSGHTATIGATVPPAMLVPTKPSASSHIAREEGPRYPLSYLFPVRCPYSGL